MMYNRLMSRSARAVQHRAPGGIMEIRCSGRTTASAFAIMSNAIRSPGVWFSCEDHHGGMAANDRLCNEVMSFAKRLELKHFERRTFRDPGSDRLVYQVRCDLFTDNPWEIA